MQSDSGNEVVDVRYMGQHVVGDKEIGVAVLGHHLSRSLLIEKRNQGVDTEFLPGDRRAIGGR